MKESSPFGDQSSIQTLKWLHQFKKLDAKQSEGLNDEEAKLYYELCEKLSHVLETGQIQKASRRKNLRVTVETEIILNSGKDFHKVYLKNISGGGVYIQNDRPLPIGSHVKIHIHLKEEKRKLELEGRVTWVNPKSTKSLPSGMGVQFENLTNKQTESIRKLVHQALQQQLKEK